MSNSVQKVDEEVPLNTIPWSGEMCDQDTSCSAQGAASCCKDKHYRKLAICSIICGISCIGIKALINSVKAEKTTDPEAVVTYSRQARKLGIISIVVWILFLVSVPILMALISYLFTLQD